MKLRMPQELRDRIVAAAVENNRSINAEIVSRLEWSLQSGVTIEVDTDIDRAMTWADHIKAMSSIVEVTARTARELRIEIAKLQGRTDAEEAKYWPKSRYESSDS